jgi:aryl-alcohol dehydrogenase-like predicted oxidoreductase
MMQETSRRHGGHISQISIGDVIQGQDFGKIYDKYDKDKSPLTLGERAIVFVGAALTVLLLVTYIHPEIYSGEARDTIFHHTTEEERANYGLHIEPPKPLGLHSDEADNIKQIRGWATVKETAKYSESRQKHKDHFVIDNTSGSSLTLSTIGIGSYLGNSDEITSEQLNTAVVGSINHGINVVDTSINYLGQNAERAIGKALKRLIIDEKTVPREAIFISTKAGFIPRDAKHDRNNVETLNKWISEWNTASQQEAIDAANTDGDGDGNINKENNIDNYPKFPTNTIVNKKHCISPACLDMSLKTSLSNLGVTTIDLLYLHNLENQFKDDNLAHDEVLLRIEKSFERLEWYRKHNVIKYYGIASWDSFRVSHSSDVHMSLHDILDIAKKVGGNDNHGFRFIQLPLSVNLPEAAIDEYMEQRRTFLEEADKLGVTIIASRSIDAGQSGKIKNTLEAFKLCAPDDINLGTSVEKPSLVAQALNVVRSTPGVKIALVGMKKMEHVHDNLKLLDISKLTPSKVKCIYEEGAKQYKQSLLHPKMNDTPKGKALAAGVGQRGSATIKSLNAKNAASKEHDGEDHGHSQEKSKSGTGKILNSLNEALGATFKNNRAFTSEHPQDPNQGDDNGDDAIEAAEREKLLKLQKEGGHTQAEVLALKGGMKDSVKGRPGDKSRRAKKLRGTNKGGNRRARGG